MSYADLLAATRTNITALRTLQASAGRSQTRLATGQRYTRLSENPRAQFDAREMRGRADYLERIVEGYSRPQRAIEAASAGIAAITGLVGQLETLARRIEEAEPASVGTPASPGTPATGPQTLTVYSKQINLDGQGNVVAGDAKIVAENAVLGPWNQTRFSASQIRDDIFVNGTRAYVPHISEPMSSYAPGDKDNRIDRIRISATDGVTTLSHDFYIGHANDVTMAYLNGDLAAGSDDVYTVRHLVQGINRELGGFLRAEVTANGRIAFEAAGDFSMELIERSPGPGSPTNPWDSLINLFGTVDAAGDGDMSTGLGTFEFAAGTGSAANYDTSATADGNYAIAFDPGTRPVGGFAAITPGTSASEATGLLREWDALIRQIEEIVLDAEYEGLNLLLGGESLQLSERNDAARLSLGTLSATTEGLGLSRSDADFSSPAAIADRIAELRGGLETLGTMGSILASASAIIDARETFSARMGGVLEDGADALTLVDSNEESARLLATQTRMELASSALSLTAQTKPFLLQYAVGFRSGESV